MKKYLMICAVVLLSLCSFSCAAVITVQNKVNIQESPTSSRVIYQYNAGETIEYQETEYNNWGKVIYDGNKYGYVNIKFLGNTQFGANSTSINGTNQQKAGQAIASFAIDAVTNHKSEFIYSYGHNGYYVGTGRQNAYLGKKTTGYAYGTSGYKAAYKGKVGSPYPYSNKYSVDCVVLVSFVIRHSLHIGNESYTRFVTSGSGAISGSGFKNIKGISVSKLMPGDIIYQDSHVMIFVGKDTSGNYIIAHAMNSSRKNVPESWGIMFGKLNKNKTYNVARITEDKAAKITSISTSM